MFRVSVVCPSVALEGDSRKPNLCANADAYIAGKIDA
jgi:hypothetical protein